MALAKVYFHVVEGKEVKKAQICLSWDTLDL